jgi:hypothetical protein
MADVLVSPLSFYRTGHTQLSQALSMGKVCGFCAS